MLLQKCLVFAIPPNNVYFSSCMSFSPEYYFACLSCSRDSWRKHHSTITSRSNFKGLQLATRACVEPFLWEEYRIKTTNELAFPSWATGWVLDINEGMHVLPFFSRQLEFIVFTTTLRTVWSQCKLLKIKKIYHRSLQSPNTDSSTFSHIWQKPGTSLTSVVLERGTTRTHAKQTRKHSDDRGTDYPSRKCRFCQAKSDWQNSLLLLHIVVFFCQFSIGKKGSAATIKYVFEQVQREHNP